MTDRVDQILHRTPTSSLLRPGSALLVGARSVREQRQVVGPWMGGVRVVPAPREVAIVEQSPSDGLVTRVACEDNGRDRPELRLREPIPECLTERGILRLPCDEVVGPGNSDHDRSWSGGALDLRMGAPNVAEDRRE